MSPSACAAGPTSIGPQPQQKKDPKCAALQARAASTEQASTSSALSPDEFRECTLKERGQHNYNTVSLKFAFKDPEATAGLPVASCLLVRAHAIGEPDDVENGHLQDVVRPYTPISEPDSKCAPCACPENSKILTHCIGPARRMVCMHEPSGTLGPGEC